MIKRKFSIPRILSDKKLAIIGYGSQGRAQALNLRDSGLRPIIGLLSQSRSRALARKEGLEVFTPQKAIERADVIALLIPDHRQQAFINSLPAEMIAHKAFIFAHGLSVAFGLVRLPSTCDIILVAPHGPGIRLREIYLEGKHFTVFWAVENDFSGQAKLLAGAYAAAIGCPPRNLFKTTFRREAVGDIFGEQAVLCGGLVGLMESGFDTLVKRGFSPDDAYLECIHQLDLIIDLVKTHGPAGMFEKISVTAAYGSLLNKERIAGADVRRRMAALLRDTEDGVFIRRLMADSRRNMADFNDKLNAVRSSMLQKTHDRLSKRLDQN